MKVQLTDGNWAEVRDKLKGKDKFAVQKSVVFDVKDNQAQQLSADLMNVMINTLLTKLIEDWSFSDPIPGKAPDPPGTPAGTGASEALGDLDIDDYNLLEAFAKPLLDKVLESPNPVTPSA